MSRFAAIYAPRALKIQRTEGTAAAAKYLEERNVYLDEALYVLLGAKVRA